MSFQKQTNKKTQVVPAILPCLLSYSRHFFNFADGDPLGQFAIIQEDEGEWGLILKERVDREAKDRYTLRVTATDGKFEAPVVVEVHVLDINDNSPLCEQVRTEFTGDLSVER